EERGAVDLRDEAVERPRRQVVGEERRRDRDDAVSEDPLPWGVVDEVVANRAAARAFRDDRLQRRRVGRGFAQHLAADREADAADAPRVDVGAALEVGNGSVDVASAMPAEGVRIALALALAATVEEQDAVAVAGQELRAGLRAGAPGERDHGG